MQSPSIRTARLAGQWYPRTGDQLEREVRRHLDAAPAPPPDAPVPLGLVSPHAGIAYSGRTAGRAYRRIQGADIETVVLIAPPHQTPIQGVSVFAGDCVESPLGSIPVDRDAVRRLLEHADCFSDQGWAHPGENTVETQIPFIQVALGKTHFSIVELLVRENEPEFYREVGNALAQAVRDRKAVLVASTDLTHFPARRKAEEIDPLTLRALAAPHLDDAHRQVKQLEERFASAPGVSCIACGQSAVFCTIAAVEALGATRGEVLDCSNSAATTGDDRRVVGYGAVAYYR